MKDEIILKADNLFYSYDDEKSHSLNGLSLEIKKGHKVAFMGQTVPVNLLFSYAATESTAPPQELSFFMENRSIIPEKGC